MLQNTPSTSAEVIREKTNEKTTRKEKNCAKRKLKEENLSMMSEIYATGAKVKANLVCED